MKLSRLVKRSYAFYCLRSRVSALKGKILSWTGCSIDNKGCVRIIKDVRGRNNRMTFKEGCRIDKASVLIRGDGNRLIIGKDCIIGRGCHFRLEGNNVSIIIGDATTLTRDVRMTVQEDNTSIIIGEDCMFSNTIIVRTSDSHPIFSLETGDRLNPPASVIIGNHVWVAPNSTIMKGAVIEDGCVIGSETMVNKRIKANVLVVGKPARVVKENIRWTREKLF